MEDENKTTWELMEEREKEIYVELGKLKFDDPKRQKLMAEAKSLADIKNAYETTENNRLNNNARNDIEEQKLVIEEAKLRNDKRRIGVDIARIIVYTIAGFGLNVASYTMDSWFQKDSRMQKFAERVHDMLTKKG